MIASRPFRILARRNFFPKRDNVRVLHDFWRIAFDMVPKASVQRRCEDKHDAVIERFTAGIRVGFLRVARAGTNDKMGVMACMQGNFADGFEVGNLLAQFECEINPRLRLIFG